MKSEDEIRRKYRSYIEIYASEYVGSQTTYGAILAYGFVLGFTAVKIEKDIEMARNKY